jgi:hypothetical protein
MISCSLTARPPHDQRVAVAKALQASVELRPRAQRPRAHVLEDALDASRLQRVELQSEVLTASRDGATY